MKNASRFTHWIRISSRQIAKILLCPPKSRVQSAPAAVNSEIESDPQICEYIWRIVAQEVRREYSSRSLEATQEAVENVHSNLFIAGTIKVERGLKNAPYKFKETLLSDMAEKAALDKIFDCSMDRWNQSILFMNAFTKHALGSSRLTRPAAQIWDRAWTKSPMNGA